MWIYTRKSLMYTEREIKKRVIFLLLLLLLLLLCFCSLPSGFEAYLSRENEWSMGYTRNPRLLIELSCVTNAHPTMWTAQGEAIQLVVKTLRVACRPAAVFFSFRSFVLQRRSQAANAQKRVFAQSKGRCGNGTLRFAISRFQWHLRPQRRTATRMGT